MAGRFMNSSYPKIQAGERPNSGTDYGPGLPEGSKPGTATMKFHIGTRMNADKIQKKTVTRFKESGF